MTNRLGFLKTITGLIAAPMAIAKVNQDELCVPNLYKIWYGDWTFGKEKLANGLVLGNARLNSFRVWRITENVSTKSLIELNEIYSTQFPSYSDLYETIKADPRNYVAKSLVKFWHNGLTINFSIVSKFKTQPKSVEVFFDGTRYYALIDGVKYYPSTSNKIG